MKSLLLSNQIDPKRIHRLDALFQSLDPDVQQAIFQSHTMGNCFIRSMEGFIHELRQLRDAFTILRYSYELNGFVVNDSLLFEFVDIPHDYCHSKIGRNSP